MKNIFVLINTYVPIIIVRKTKQTLPDLFKTKHTGAYMLTQGGFADYTVFVGTLSKL